MTVWPKQHAHKPATSYMAVRFRVRGSSEGAMKSLEPKLCSRSRVTQGLSGEKHIAAVSKCMDRYWRDTHVLYGTFWTWCAVSCN